MIEFAIKPETEQAHNEVMDLLNDADCVIRGIRGARGRPLF